MIQVLNKAFNILEYLSWDASREVPLGEIASALNMDKGTCANILKTLCMRGYVDQELPRKGYKLGYMVFRLGDPYVNKEELTRKSMEELDNLGARLNEVVLLSVLKQDKRVMMYNTTPDQDLIVRTSRENPVYRATTGRVILSYASLEERVRFVRKYGLPKPGDWEGVESFEDLMKELDRTREAGWRIDRNKNMIIGMAVPVWKGNKVVASIGVYLPEVRFSAKRHIEILSGLKKTADNIRLKLSEPE